MNIPFKTLPDGKKIPSIGMGTFGSDHATPCMVSAAVAGAIRHGYRLFDCASVYGNEDKIGEVFANAVDEGIVTRGELFVTSKVWNDMHGNVLVSLKKTLEDLRFNYIDAYFVHWPFPNYHAPGCGGNSRNPDSKPFSAEHFVSVWRQMEQACEAGLARYIGMSNMTVSKLKAVLPLCKIKPAFIEMELHPSFQQKELFEYCLTQNILPIGFCPLGSPSRPERDKTENDIADMEMPEIVEIAKNRNIHPALVCLKWAVQRGQIPIPFSTKENEYTANLHCVTQDPLTDDE